MRGADRKYYNMICINRDWTIIRLYPIRTQSRLNQGFGKFFEFGQETGKNRDCRKSMTKEKEIMRKIVTQMIMVISMTKMAIRAKIMMLVR